MTRVLGTRKGLQEELRINLGHNPCPVEASGKHLAGNMGKWIMTFGNNLLRNDEYCYEAISKSV